MAQDLVKCRYGLQISYHCFATFEWIVSLSVKIGKQGQNLYDFIKTL